MSQGIPRNKEEVIEALRPYFELDYSVNKACEIVGFPQSTFQTWVDADDDLRLKVQAWRAQPSVQSRKNWVEAIKDGRPTKFGPDKYTPAKDWLERREKDDWSTRSEFTGKDGEKLADPVAIGTVVGAEILNVTKKYEEELRKALAK